MHKPCAREIKLIFDALEINPNYLIYGTEEPHKKKEGLAHTVLAMGESAFVPLSILVPLLAAVLGYDEKRKILEYVETTIKAQSPELLADVMSILSIVPKSSEIDLDKAIEQSPDPELSRRLIQIGRAHV